jgi:O-antigen/teichoic acid export membrane protein
VRSLKYLSFNNFTLYSFWSVIGFGISQASSLIVFIILARLLSKEDVASYALMQSIIAAGMTCCGLWIGTGVTRFIALNSKSDKLAAGRYAFLGIISSFFLSILAALLLYNFSDFFSLSLFGSKNLSPYLKIISFIIILHSIDSIQMQTLQSLVAFKEISKNNLIKAVLLIPIMGIGAYKFDVLGAFYGLLLMSLIFLVINYYSVRKYFSINNIQYVFKLKRIDFYLFYKYATPLFFGALLGTPVILIANSILSQGALGIEQVAYFAIASQWRSLIQHIPKRMTDVALPMLSTSHGNDNNGDFYETFIQTNTFSLLFGYILVTILMFNIPIIISLYGESFEGANITIGLMLLAGGISCHGSGIAPLIYSKGYTVFGLYTNLIWSSIFILTSLYFIDILGAAALALGMCIGYVLTLSITIIYLSYKKEVSIILFYKSLFGISLMILIFGFSIFINQLFSIIYVLFFSIIFTVIVSFVLINYIIDDNIKSKLVILYKTSFNKR